LALQGGAKQIHFFKKVIKLHQIDLEHKYSSNLKVFLHHKKTKLISYHLTPFKKGEKGKQNYPLTFKNNPTSSLPSHPRNNSLERSLPFTIDTIPIPVSKGIVKKNPISLKKQPLARGKSPPPFPIQKIGLLKKIKKRKIPNLSFLLETPLISRNVIHSTYFYYLPFISIQTPILNNNPFA